MKISIDLRIQKFVHKELSQHKAGSIVVVDIHKGEIISMVSIPDYNPNLIIKKPNKNFSLRKFRVVSKYKMLILIPYDYFGTLEPGRNT